MRQSIGDNSGDYMVVEAGSESIADDGEVRVMAPASEETIATGERVSVLTFTPDQAWEAARALLRAADEAESGVSEEARLRLELAAVDDALKEAGIAYPLGARAVCETWRASTSSRRRVTSERRDHRPGRRHGARCRVP